MKILVVGSSNTDFVVRTKSFPKPGETVLGDGFFMNAGGKGANQAVAAARLGAAVTFACKVGDDYFGKQAKDTFIKNGIDATYVDCLSGIPSGVALIAIDEKAENSIVVASGANAMLKPEDMDRIKDIDRFDAILTQLETPMQTVIRLSEIAVKENVPFILNPAPAVVLSNELLRNTFLLTPNERELGIIADMNVGNDNEIDSAAMKLISLGVKNVLVTLGSKGSMLCNEKGIIRIQAHKVKAVDTTGAGDVYNGALAVSFSESKDLRKAMIFASAASAISVTRYGAQPSAPTRKEVDDFITNNYNEK